MATVTERRKILGLKRLLVATDLSSRAEKAITRAVQLAEQHSGTLSVLHIWTGASGHETERPQIASRIEKDLRRKLEALSLKRTTLASVRVLSGTPFVEIIRQGREEAADLIVVGAHGKDFMKDLLLGTTAEKIVRKGDRSVLVVKQAAQSSYRRVLVGVDFSDNSRHALELALRLAPQAEFHALHVYAGVEGMLRRAGVTDSGIVRYQRKVAKDARQQMEVFIRSIDRRRKPIRREVWNGRAGREITTIARRQRADLVAVGTAGRTGIPYILLGSIAEHVMREAQCDVLVVRSGSTRFELP
jgi:nucleotide-binding universal stress UspA family protein